jgi:hypothetical protein
LSLRDNRHCYSATIKKRRPQKSLPRAIINTIISSLPAAASHSDCRYRSHPDCRATQWDLSGLQVIHPVSLLRSWTPVEPICPCLGGHIGAAPTLGAVKASDDEHFGAHSRSFGTGSPTLRVSCCHSPARLASGWRGWPLPGGSRTLRITAKGFRSYGHPPLLFS